MSPQQRIQLAFASVIFFLILFGVDEIVLKSPDAGEIVSLVLKNIR